MPRPKYPTPRRPGGFSLILSLTVMAMLLLLCLGAVALLTIQLRVAQAGISYTKARLNAMAGARIALGTLQAQAGPDMRITAPATILDTNPATFDRSEGVALPRLTGVWRGRSVSSDYPGSHDKALIGWLLSGTAGLKPDELRKYPEKTTLDATNAVLLLRATKPTPDSDPGLVDADAADVFAPEETLPTSTGGTEGKFAWWVSDENQKANLTLRIPADAGIPGAVRTARNSPRFGLKLASDGDLKNFPEPLPFHPGIMSRESLVFDSPSPGNPSAAWLKQPHDYYHSITPYSESLLTDVVNGGLKYDLSLLLAMDRLPEGYYGDKAYVGMESKSGAPYPAAKGKWLDSGPAANIHGTLTAGTPTTNYNQAEWTCWGDVRNYARLYKYENLKADGMLMNSADDAYSYPTHTNTLDPNKNVSDHGNLSAWREPVVTQLQVAVGMFATEVPNSNPKKYALQMVVRPALQLWNPYNVPLKFTTAELNSIYGRLVYLPGKAMLEYTEGGSRRSISLNASNGSSLRTLLGADDTYNTTLIAYINHVGRTPLEPGEVRVFSPPALASGLQTAGLVEMKEGLVPTGGYTRPAMTNVSSRTATPIIDGTGIVHVRVDGPVPGNNDGTTTWLDMGRRTGAGASNNFSSPGRGWLFNRVNTVRNALMPFESDFVDSSVALLAGKTATNPRFFALFTMRLRAETTSNLTNATFPYLMYGDPIRTNYQPDGSIPYAQNQSLLLSPYEFIHRRVTDEDSSEFMQVNFSEKDRGYAFTGYTSEHGISRMILSRVPLGPLGGMGELRDARLGGGIAYARQMLPQVARRSQADQLIRLTPGVSVVQNAFGNSFAHPMIKANELIRPQSAPFPNESFFDFSWIMNAALWDSYCMTGLTPQDSDFTAYGAKKSLEALGKDFFDGKGLPDPRLLLRDYGVGPAAMKALVVENDKPTPEGYAKVAAMMSVNGGFNVNSTSVRAWRALLSGLNGGKLATIKDSGIATPTTQTVNNDNPVLTGTIQHGPLAATNTGSYDKTFNQARTLAGRKLSDEQLTKLAQEIVRQVKLRGPFLSLGEFMNRRLDTDGAANLNKVGAIQAAIDATDINRFSTAGQVKQVANIGSAAFPNEPAVAGTSQARGMPGVISQADLIGPIAARITPRSDTFTIRASGSADDGTTAHVELVVRRTAAFIDSSDAPFIPVDALKKIPNKAFGRRIAIVANRWVNREEL